MLLVAVFLGNVPESLGSAVGMRHAGRSRRHIVTVWGARGGRLHPGLDRGVRAAGGTLGEPDRRAAGS